VHLGFLADTRLPATVALAAIAALGYFVSRSRKGPRQFTLYDFVATVFLMAIVAATSVPLLEAASQGVKQSTLIQNLADLRAQIKLYRLQHGGEPPVYYERTLPQLVQATDAGGVPGPVGSRRPYGPYFPRGIPVNPLTGRATVTLTDTFPPTNASGNGGWLYHQATGRIAIDAPGLLDR
jgi:type II secretory pathway pseudopilin PulG